MLKNEYPRWMYHATEAAQIADDPASADALGDGWFTSPTEALAPKAEPVTKKKPGKH